jgi:outer membrane lipoprotein SlyB
MTGPRLAHHLLIAACLFGAASHVQADDRYAYCQRQAERISGYYGPVPNRYLPGGVGRGAVRGAASGAVIGAIGGGDRKQIRRAARRGAVAGAVVGAARRARARDEQHDRRYIYHLELDRCMDNYR